MAGNNGISPRKVPGNLKRDQSRRFIKYLDDNKLKNVTDKQQLKQIFNDKFKPDLVNGGYKEPVTNFSSVMFLCKDSGVARVNNGQVAWNPGRNTIRPYRRPRSQREHSGSPQTSHQRPQNETSQKHQDSANQSSVPASVLLSEGSADSLPSWIAIVRDQLHCQVCGVNLITAEMLKTHSTGRKHLVQGLILSLKKNKPFLVKNKEGITISSPFDLEPKADGAVRLDILENHQSSFDFEIHNTNDQAVIFKNCEMLKKVRVFTLRDSSKVTDGTKEHVIPPNDKYKVSVSANADHVGRYHSPVAFIFKLVDKPEQLIHIVRYLSCRCHNPVVEAAQPLLKYKPQHSTNFKNRVEVIDGVVPAFENFSKLEQVINLPPSPVPPAIRQYLRNNMEINSLSESDSQHMLHVLDSLWSDMSWRNYIERFSSLLHIEEVQMEKDIRRYDMDDVTMGTCENPNLLTLQVPGLAENRPSVMKGDVLYVRRKLADGTTEDKEYKGYVHNVRLNEVWLGFHKRLVSQFVANMKFAVRFTFNRLPLRLMHRAITLADENSLDKMLFPRPDTACSMGTILPLDTNLKLVNKQLEKNAEQLRAIKHIVAGTSRPAPYLVYGPPGTGKTVTIVEAMQQVLLNLPSCRILACAPSNSAADLIVHRLLQGRVVKSQVYRMCALSRLYSTVPDNIKEVCNYDKKTKQFVYPAKEALGQYKVIVTTLVTAGRLASANFPAGYFSHIFMDEAGHAMEPEAVIAVAGIMESDILNKDGGQLVLAGDPEQLGPILRSPLAVKYGLGVSLLERYMHKCEVYQRKEGEQYDPQLVTKLLQNYRSHPAILQLPNEQFYCGELLPCADKLERESLCGWEGLVKPGFPVLFHGVLGQDMREQESPSFFNPEEVAVVLSYVTRLLDSKSPKIHPKDIGIISPYRKQVQKLQKALKNQTINNLKVGSTEEFQGQENKVIIISTVRSNPDFLAMDYEYKLGFLTNPKRFNVALTRAKALLIVVGNPNILARDPHWQQLLTYCRQNGSYTGCDYEEPDDQLEDIMQRFAATKLDDLQFLSESESPSVKQQVEDLPWRYEN